ncbi:MAG TPA: lysylphosphatidylglycerol synthase transmembrane domain-containing protein [Deltaproteobacteria bacterium]|nr:lysylphosphatidylglycerol synthase transmembrane domain-containing protein [Deltaproteobacteria bacterium]HOI05592.1 lysylphosphatidylglycerol synthase transmembrane domain-containing protein [Deltaproteobacteria bacterium]
MNAVHGPGDDRGCPGAQGDVPPRRRTPLWKRALPFATAGAIITYLFVHIDMHRFLAALLGADISLYLPWLVAFIVITFLLDTQNLALVLKEFRHPIAFRSALGIRGGTYLLMTIDHTLGLGALAYYLKHELAIPVMRSTGVMLFFNTITQLTLTIMATIGLILVPPSSLPLRYFFILCIGFLGSVLIFVAAMKKLPSRGCGSRIRDLNLLKVFHEASWRSYCSLILWRGVYYLVFIGFFYIALRAFHMHVPLSILTAYVPIILMVVSMPITPCGLGTAQAAMLYLFGDYGPSGTIMAFGLTYSTSILLLRSVIGLIFVNSIAGFVPGKAVR